MKTFAVFAAFFLAGTTLTVAQYRDREYWEHSRDRDEGRDRDRDRDRDRYRRLDRDDHGRRFYRGQWYEYGVGPCWRQTPVGYVWICG